ncbi:MAG: hypothetical protein ACRDQ7_23245 [Haloechinothrix sp.]
MLRVKPRYGVLVPVFVDSGVPFIRVNDLLDLENRAANLAQIPQELSRQYARTRTQQGDLLLSVVGTMGRATVIPDVLIGANVARAIASLRPYNSVDPQLLAAWMCSPEFLRQALDATSSDTAQPTLGMEDLSNFTLLWPKGDVAQRRLTRQVNEIRSKQASLASALNRQLDLLAERRQALITAAVTGQLDVTTARSGVQV